MSPKSPLSHLTKPFLTLFILLTFAALTLSATSMQANPANPALREAAISSQGSFFTNGVVFTDVTLSHLPPSAFVGSSMDARPVDVDNDMDLDLVVAREFGTNVLLVNDGMGLFSDESALRFPLPQPAHDSEDVAFADFDLDEDVDLVFVSEDDAVNELYFNDGTGVFTDASDRLPVTGTSNALLAVNIDGDEDVDLLIGNAGQNVVLINDGDGFFSNETAERLPPDTRITQDLEVGDIDDDEDLDLLVANENGNRLLLNDGTGVFSDTTEARLPLPIAGEETREADFGDADGDGDLDIFFANVTFWPGSSNQNRLLLNDGNGFFTDVTAERLPPDSYHTVDGDFYDIDNDDDLDLLLANAFGGNYQVLLNDGDGYFTEATDELFLSPVTGNGIDVEVADFNGDLLADLYLTGYQGTDHLLFAQKRLEMTPTPTTIATNSPSPLPSTSTPSPLPPTSTSTPTLSVTSTIMSTSTPSHIPSATPSKMPSVTATSTLTASATLTPSTPNDYTLFLPLITR